MPELPEVERGRLIAERALGGQTLTSVHAADDNIVFDNTPAAQFRQALQGRRVEAVHRHGKQLWFELDRAPHPLFHFGMSGGFHTQDTPSLQLITGPKEASDAWPPRFSKIELQGENGSSLVMTDARRLGRIRLRDAPLDEPPLSLLGPDAYLALPGPSVFAQDLSKRRTIIKGLLLDQQFIAGIGNWIADEVLFQAGIDPRRPANDLTRDEARRLRSKIAVVIKRAVSCIADDKDYPATWLFHRRWGKQAGMKTSRGDLIEYLTVSGRTTAWVPVVQC